MIVTKSTQEWLCKTKIHFGTSQEAFAYVEMRRNKKWRKEEKLKRLKPYKCPLCKDYHLTSNV